MKFLKNMFGSKQKQNAKYEANTLAEANGSPDLRLATTKEKEADIPVIKKEEVKKIPRKSDRTSTAKAKSVGSESTTTKSKSSSTTKNTASKSAAGVSKTGKLTTDTEVKKATSKAKSSTVTKTKAASEKNPAKSGTKSDEKSTNAVKAAKKVAATPTKATQSASVKTTEVAKSPNKKVEASQKSTVDVAVPKSAKTGKFEIKKSKDGRFVFNLYASNNVIVATSQVYSSSTSAMNGIKSVIANAEAAPIEDQTLKNVTTVSFPKWEIYLDKGEQYRFRLCASNGSCVCHSQGYTSKANCKKGIESIIKTAKDAEITKPYLDKKEN